MRLTFIPAVADSGAAAAAVSASALRRADYPVGGSGAIINALVRGLEKNGGKLRLGTHVEQASEVKHSVLCMLRRSFTFPFPQDGRGEPVRPVVVIGTSSFGKTKTAKLTFVSSISLSGKDPMRIGTCGTACYLATTPSSQGSPLLFFNPDSSDAGFARGLPKGALAK